MTIKTGKYYSQWGLGVSLVHYTKGMWSIVVDLGPYYIDFYNMKGNTEDNLESYNAFYKDIDDDFGPAPDCAKCGKESESWDNLMYELKKDSMSFELLCKDCLGVKPKIDKKK